MILGIEKPSLASHFGRFVGEDQAQAAMLQAKINSVAYAAKAPSVMLAMDLEIAGGIATKACNFNVGQMMMNQSFLRYFSFFWGVSLFSDNALLGFIGGIYI